MHSREHSSDTSVTHSSSDDSANINLPHGRAYWNRSPFTLPETARLDEDDVEEFQSPTDDAIHLRTRHKDWSLIAGAKLRPTPIIQDKQHEEYWAFLKSVPDSQRSSLVPSSRCPSLVSRGTLSSRNSSTRSARSSVWDSLDERSEGVRSGLMGLDPNELMLLKEVTNTHSTPLQFYEELCPITTCDRHHEGFTRAGDGRRHAFTHFKGSLVCGFCKPNPTSFLLATDRVNLFLTHLAKVHGSRATTEPDVLMLKPRKHDARRTGVSEPVADCSVCSEPFTAHVMYEHLPGCIIREITKRQEIAQHIQEEQTSYKTGASQQDKPAGNSIMLEQGANEQQLSRSLGDIPESDDKDIEELTASSRCLSLTSSRAAETSEEETDWTEDMTSRESSPGVSQVPRRLSPAKRKVVETVMQEFQRLFNHTLRTNTHGGSSSSSSYNGSGNWSSNASTYSSASFVSRKRSLSGGGSTPPNDDDDDSNKRRRPDPRNGSKQSAGDLRFACPFYKRNPGRHTTFTSCRDPGFTTVARLKEHLYRRHLLPPQCHRCCKTFTDDIGLREHQRDIRGCEVQEQIPLEGFDKDQERRLKSKKRSQQYQSEEDKWKGVYAILFPDDGDADMPSPYIEYTPSNGQAAPDPSNVAAFQQFSRLELPRLVRRTLESVVEREARPLEDKLKDRLVDIVKECQSQLEAMFHTCSSNEPQGDLTEKQSAPKAPRKGRNNSQESVTSVHSSHGKQRDTGIGTPQLHLNMSTFEGFDSSLPVRTTTREFRATNYSQKVRMPQVSGLVDESLLSRSPDPGSLSHWPVALDADVSVNMNANSHTHEVTSTMQVDAFVGATHGDTIDLSGYYGLFGGSSAFGASAEQVNIEALRHPSWTGHENIGGECASSMGMRVGHNDAMIEVGFLDEGNAPWGL